MTRGPDRQSAGSSFLFQSPQTCGGAAPLFATSSSPLLTERERYIFSFFRTPGNVLSAFNQAIAATFDIPLLSLSQSPSTSRSIDNLFSLWFSASFLQRAGRGQLTITAQHGRIQDETQGEWSTTLGIFTESVLSVRSPGDSSSFLSLETHDWQDWQDWPDWPDSPEWPARLDRLARLARLARFWPDEARLARLASILD